MWESESQNSKLKKTQKIWYHVLKGKGWVETIHCWGQPEYCEESWRFEETYCLSNFSGRPSVNAAVKNPQRNKIIITNEDKVNEKLYKFF